MASINRILVPVDGSVGSGRAVEKALFLAEKCGAALDFLYVADAIGGENPGEVIFSEIWKNLPEGLTAEKHVASGNVAHAILDTAEKCQVGMIVMGSRGLGIFRGAFLGSVSQKVIEDAAIPVMVVK